MNFKKIGNSSNFLIWIILIVIATGFGNFGSNLGINCFRVDECIDDKHSRRRYKGNVCYASPGFSSGGFGGLFGGNAIFIILVIALLFLCKDKKEDYETLVFENDDEFEFSS